MDDRRIDALVVRRRPLSDDQRDVPIYYADGSQIPAATAEIVWLPAEHPAQERFELAFFDAEGDFLEGLAFETLEIALDQAKAIADIDGTQWEVLAEPPASA